MFLGEVEYGDNFGDKTFLSQLTLGFFVFGLSIVLMNVLTGVAVVEVEQAKSSHSLDLANCCYDIDSMAVGPLAKLFKVDRSRKVYVYPNDCRGKMRDQDIDCHYIDNEEIQSMTRDICISRAEQEAEEFKKTC